MDPKFKSYMLETYDIVPLLLNKSVLKAFFAETETNHNYINFLRDWQLKSGREQQAIAHKNQYYKPKQFEKLQPYVWLLTDFLQKNHGNDIENSQKLLDLTDLRSPEEWYSDTAGDLKRKIIYHMGPTNSGKTKHALDALIQAKSGIYLAPLRMLAWEVAERLGEHGVQCNMMTGQE